MASNIPPSEVLALAAEATRYTVVGQMQFPTAFVGGNTIANFHARYGINSCLMPVDFAQQVRELHAFLYDDPNYQVPAGISSIANAMAWEINN